MLELVIGPLRPWSPLWEDVPVSENTFSVFVHTHTHSLRPLESVAKEEQAAGVSGC